MYQIGQTYTLEVVQLVDFGVYLDAGDLGSVLLPRRYVPEDLDIGDSLSVFLYLDSEDRPVATTETPKAKVGEFAYLEVKQITSIGAFLDWGLEKDVLVPFAEQHKPMEEGESYIVHLYLDRLDGRVAASSKIDKFLDREPHSFQANQPVKLLIANTTDLGFKAIVNNTHWGVLYTSEVHERLSFGQRKSAFIKGIRPDGKIDLSLHGGAKTRDEYTHRIELYLKKNDGFAAVHDKSDPKEISKLFGMSKGAFKKAIGGLYKAGVIVIEKDGIHLQD